MATAKVYNQFADKFGNQYGFNNYADFAQFWFNIPYSAQINYFPANREELQKAAANSNEARTKA